MSKYKVGDAFIVKIKEVMDSDNGTLYRSNFSTLVFDDYGLDNLQKYEDSEYAEGVKEGLASLDCEVKKAYEKGLANAWKLADKLNEIPIGTLAEIFDEEDSMWVIQNFTYQEALAKIEAYEESKAIKVGNVVVCKLDDIQGVVIDIISDEECYTYNENGCVEEHKFKYLKKTGRHLDIEHLLEQIRGDQ